MALLLFRIIGDLQDFDRVIVVGQELVHPDDDLLTELDLTLEGGRRLGNLPLEPAALDSPNDAADRADLGEQRFGFTLELVGECLDVVGPAQRVDHLRDASLVRQDLLRPQGHLHRLLGR